MRVAGRGVRLSARRSGYRRRWANERNRKQVLTTMTRKSLESTRCFCRAQRRRDCLGLSIAIVLRRLQFDRFTVYRDSGRVRRVRGRITVRRRVAWLVLLQLRRYGYSTGLVVRWQFLVRIVGAILHDHLAVLRRSRLVQYVDRGADWLLLVL